MNILSFNIRGCGSSIKRRKLRKMIEVDQPDMVFLQETKSQAVRDGFIRSLWGADDIEWSAKDSIGASGGLIIMWKKGIISPIFSFKTVGSLGISAVFNNQVCFFVNVYSSCQLHGKRLLWLELVEWKNRAGPGWWCVGGDFNSIRMSNERQGSILGNRSNEMQEFNDFIDLMDLVDVPVIGKRFTWSNKDGSSKSRLDRFLLSSDLIDEWRIVGQSSWAWDILDHTPIWFKARDVNWGPKPFRVNNCWFDVKDFQRFCGVVMAEYSG
ncbi:uncharacterized protein LOC131597858 [Vicia villosa]|uniref:uncharacterized protein LOC131597858 n=1 Tax=Vicia villosa TaxID=3911 RepID=UPI00273C62B0|nr:uncharacterized protein LOC131597858 [Vicia villosa]